MAKTTDEPLNYDSTTGLPALKEGNFWRVDHYYPQYSHSVLRISIMKRAPRWYNKDRAVELTWRNEFWGDFKTAKDKPEFIKKVAEEMIKSFLDRDEANTYLGDYPPKSLAS